jgi:hypothetical protein
VKKVAPVVLMAAAVYFTAGAALSVAGTAGGWAGAASSIGAMGGSLAPVLTGAIQYAGYGAIAGGAMAGLQGKNIIKGAGRGALTGAITGGVLGAVAPGAVGVPGTTPNGMTIGSTAPSNGLLPAAKIEGFSTGGIPGLDSAAASGPTLTTSLTPTFNAVDKVGSLAKTSGGAGWFSRNKDALSFVGDLAKTGISAYGGVASTKAAGKLALQQDRENAARIAANYAGVGNFLRTTPTGNGLLAGTPEGDDPSGTDYGYRYAYNHDTRRLERVPVSV